MVNEGKSTNATITQTITLSFGLNSVKRTSDRQHTKQFLYSKFHLEDNKMTKLPMIGLNLDV